MIEQTDIEFKAEYLDQIAEMDRDQLEPLEGRFTRWIRNGVARRMIGFREESINISEAVKEGKIIIVRMGAESKSLKRMIGTAILRRIWSTIRSRANVEEHNRDEFFLFCDEFDNLVLQDETIQTMFSESRSYSLCLTAAMQYPSQVDDEIIDGILNNTKTVHGFNPGRAKSARAFNTELGLDTETLTAEADYHQWLRVDTNDGMERSDAFRVYTHPPYPPLRTPEEAEEIRQQALKEYGREVPSQSARKRGCCSTAAQGAGKLASGRRSSWQRTPRSA